MEATADDGPAGSSCHLSGRTWLQSMLALVIQSPPPIHVFPAEVPVWMLQRRDKQPLGHLPERLT